MTSSWKLHESVFDLNWFLFNCRKTTMRKGLFFHKLRNKAVYVKKKSWMVFRVLFERIFLCLRKISFGSINTSPSIMWCEIKHYCYNYISFNLKVWQLFWSKNKIQKKINCHIYSIQKKIVITVSTFQMNPLTLPFLFGFP